MSSAVHHFRDHAMATHFQVRIRGDDATYAAQAAQACFARIHGLEAQLSRFRPQSEICRAASLKPGEAMWLTADAFHCLELAKTMEVATGGAFSATAAAMQRHGSPPQWSLDPSEQSIRCERGLLEFDLGAIGKGYALDRAAELLGEWECESYLLVAGGSSILAGDPPRPLAGWSCGLGDDGSPHRLMLANCSLSGSGLRVKGSHILDPRTGSTAARTSRAWALCETAAESDALSTAAMVLEPGELAQVLDAKPDWLVIVQQGWEVQPIGRREMPSFEE